MSNQVTISDDVRNAAEAIVEQARPDLGMMSMLKFKKGDYFVDGQPVALGTTYMVFAQEWVKTWVHFVDKVPVEKHIYRPSRREIPLERKELPDTNPALWEKFGPEGKPKDPWVLQYLLPFEDIQSGAVSIFVGQSFGAQRAVSEVCNAWGTHVRRTHQASNPIVELRVSSFRSKNWGQVIRPLFNIVKYEDGVEFESGANGGGAPPKIEIESLELKDEFHDEIPF